MTEKRDPEAARRRSENIRHGAQRGALAAGAAAVALGAGVALNDGSDLPPPKSELRVAYA
ncbi:hypothetical protein HNR12_001746 [Streptomonospora nanhaiensis]|uniref:Uncharacterized protein n=1 Tax=Streptomonospora nanhaiensis TaxID=1323731 RepID=A0A853BJ33_9ACTN|nr:hypothetical protein [Streptomonospora nanhaiensis]MBX9391118.1 hypothetical protein [Streptomonospora nanhaiensis]NYI95469.1 hypothetical protein [Streptomonospora nanhaiensis]